MRRTRADIAAQRVNAGRRAAARRPCPTCGADTYVGIDADRDGVLVTADVVPLGAIGELEAFVAARVTFDVHREGSTVHLRRRPEHAPRGGDPVVSEHRCEEHPQLESEPVLF